MEGRPHFIPKEYFRYWCKPSTLDKYMLIDDVKPSSFIRRRELMGRPIKDKDGRYRLIDIFAIGRANGLTISPPRLLSKTEELAALHAEILHLKTAISNMKDFARPEAIRLSDISGEQCGYRLLREAEIANKAMTVKPIVGVYFLVRAGRVVYVGQSINVTSRVYSHLIDKDFDSATYIACTWRQLDLLESLYIHLLEPEYNLCIVNGHEKGSKHAPINLKDILNDYCEKLAPAVK